MVFKAATPERPTNGGQWSCIYLVRGCERAAGSLEVVAGDGLNQTPMVDQVVTWPRLPGHRQKVIGRVNDC